MSHSHSHSNSPDHPHLHHPAPPPLPPPPPPPPAVAHNQITTANGCSGSSSAVLHCAEDASEVVLSGGISESHSSLIPSSIIITAPDEKTIAGLIESETQFMPSQNFPHRLRDQSINSSARRDSINWILKVQAHYNFQPVTALLSVNYLDRFLSSHSLPQGNGWPFQLLSVACLSLAAKMEEPEVPLLLDLQVLDPGFLFDPKTIQRMELSVMSNLHWRLRSVTAFDFLHYFISNLLRLSPQKLPQDCLVPLISASSDLILGSTRVNEILGFPPSVVAAAAVLCAAGESSDAPESEGLVLHEKLNREMVRSCHQLMEDSLMDTCPSAIPPSPAGVLDAAACGSLDTRNENPPTSTATQTQLLLQEFAERADHNYHQPPPRPPPPPPPPFPKRLRSSASDVQKP